MWGSSKVLYKVRSAESGRKCLNLKNKPTYLDSSFVTKSVWHLKFQFSGVNSFNILPIGAEASRRVIQVIFIRTQENAVCLLNI